MNVGDLSLVHITKERLARKAEEAPIGSERVALETSLNPFQEQKFQNHIFVDTCQRQFWITHRQTLNQLMQSPRDFQDFDILHGAEAYSFLLQISCGLKSAIIGETEIFGQIKQAWADVQNGSSSAQSSSNASPKIEPIFKKQISSLMQKLFEDTKKIRRQHLQNLGQNSYGSLVRKIAQVQSSDTVLLVGAGQLAQSVAPYICQGRLLIWNRTQEKSHQLAHKTNAKSKRGVTEVLSSESDLLSAWAQADHVIICVPVTEEIEKTWIESRLKGLNLLQSTQFERAKTIHLGCTDDQSHHWQFVPGFVTLSHLFEMQKEQIEERQGRILAAQKSCHLLSEKRFIAAKPRLPRVNQSH